MIIWREIEIRINRPVVVLLWPCNIINHSMNN